MDTLRFPYTLNYTNTLFLGVVFTFASKRKRIIEFHIKFVKSVSVILGKNFSPVKSYDQKQ